MPRSELKKPTKRNIKKALKNHVKVLYESMKAQDIRIKDLQIQLAKAQEEHGDLRKAWALASKNVSYYEAESKIFFPS
jgi:hypothetical protein